MMAEAIFAAGCFWGVEDAFRQLSGVTEVEAGYTGGTTENPSYEEICSGTTGHAEAVRLTFDETQITYPELLEAFFGMHDPRQVNRQGPDIGTQYRSAVFTGGDGQKKLAHEAKGKIDAALAGEKVATEIVPASTFWRAEEYHQRYFAKHREGK